MSAVDRRAQIEARLAAATPGPWVATYEEADEWTSITGQGGPLDGGGWLVCPEVATCEGEHGADADLIAQAPADLRWLLDALAEAEAERDALATLVREAALETYTPDGSERFVAAFHRALGERDALAARLAAVKGLVALETDTPGAVDGLLSSLRDALGGVR